MADLIAGNLQRRKRTESYSAVQTSVWWQPSNSKRWIAAEVQVVGLPCLWTAAINSHLLSPQLDGGAQVSLASALGGGAVAKQSRVDALAKGSKAAEQMTTALVANVSAGL
jgi:hypothetical protein